MQMPFWRQLWLSLFWVLYFTCGNCFAAPEPKAATSEEISKLNDRISTLEKTAEIQQNKMQLTLEAADKRIADLSQMGTWQGTLMAILGILITIVVAAASILAYYNASEKAKETANKWIEEHTKELQDKITTLEQEVVQAQAQALHTINDHTTEFKEKTRALVKQADSIFAARMSYKAQFISDVEESDKLPATEFDQNLNDLRFKATADFSARDHFIAGIAAFRNGEYGSALRSFDAAILASDAAPASEQANYVLARGNALFKLDQMHDAIHTYEGIATRFNSASGIEIEEVLAHALNNKIVVYRLQKSTDLMTQAREQFLQQFAHSNSPTIRAMLVQVMYSRAKLLSESCGAEEAVELFQEIITKFSHETTPEIQSKVANANNSLGDKQLLLAKKNWHDLPRRQEYLRRANQSLLLALSNIEARFRPFVLGNLGYCHFLSDRIALARLATQECIQLGGKELIDNLRADAKVARLDAEDSAYEQMLDELATTLSDAS